MAEVVIAYIDGASRGNPGPAAAGFILNDAAGTQLQAKAFCLGRTTNNVAEYTGIVKALEAAKQIGTKQITVFSDSELLVKQINGEYKVRSEHIRPLFQRAVDSTNRGTSPPTTVAVLSKTSFNHQCRPMVDLDAIAAVFLGQIKRSIRGLE